MSAPRVLLLDQSRESELAYNAMRGYGICCDVCAVEPEPGPSDAALPMLISVGKAYCGIEGIGEFLAMYSGGQDENKCPLA